MTKTAFITGITGQDGSYLARFLLGKGYRVHGLVRWDAVEGTQRIADIADKITLHNGDVSDANNINHLIKDIRPDEIYHLAALSHVGVSFETPSSVLDIITKGSLNIFEAVRLLKPDTKIYQASSSEMFGSSPAPQNETTPMNPCSPYGVAKLATYHLAKIYRESYGLFIANGILFNHESPVRGEDFVTRKITRSIGEGKPFKLGNLDARRDWGHAADYVRGMWMMLQHDRAEDFILASGQSHTVREFVEKAFAAAGSKITWQGKGTNETGLINGQPIIIIDPALYRPKEVDHLQGDASKAENILGWQAEISFEDLIREMVESDAHLRRRA